jgi:hypothetical protein
MPAPRRSFLRFRSHFDASALGAGGEISFAAQSFALRFLEFLARPSVESPDRDRLIGQISTTDQMRTKKVTYLNVKGLKFCAWEKWRRQVRAAYGRRALSI